jgi:hypothetical protein
LAQQDSGKGAASIGYRRNESSGLIEVDIWRQASYGQTDALDFCSSKPIGAGVADLC